MQMVGKLTFFAGPLITTTVQPMKTSYAGPVAPQSLLSQGASGDASAIATFGTMNVRSGGAGAIGSTVAVCGGMTAYPDAHDLARDLTIRPRNL
jgi:hypothetical protein